MPIRKDAFGGDPKPAEPQEDVSASPPKRKRRTKAELLADAVIPGNDDKVQLKFESTGNKGERPWLVAVELVREKKAEFVDKSLKYAMEKMDQQKADKGSGMDAAAADRASAQDSERPLDQVDLDGLLGRWSAIQSELDDTGKSESEKIETLSQEAELVRQQIIAGGGTDPESDEGYAERAGAITGSEAGKPIASLDIPPDAEIGDEVRDGPDTYRVGHGGVLTQGPISDKETGDLIKAKNRWQRELGAGAAGKWEKTFLSSPEPKTNGHKDHVHIEREIVDPEMTEVRPGTWKIGTGVLEKIGLPDYSGLQVGPNTMSSMVVDDGRRIEVELPAPTLPEGKRMVFVPAAVVEKYQELEDTVEYVTRIQRGHLIAFLEAVKPGSTQPRV